MEGTGSSGGHGVVLKNVDVALSEADVVRLLQEQNLSAISASRFHRTARGKPAKALPLMRVMVSDEAQQMALLSSGAHIMGTHCPAGPVHNKADSASARGWTPDGPQHRPNRQPPKPEPPPAPTTAVEAVAPLQMVPYAEQLAQKRASVLEALEPLSSASFQVDSVLPSPRTEGYRNKCEFSIGTDASGQPCVGFVVGRQSGAHTIESPASVSLVSSEMRAAVDWARSEGNGRVVAVGICFGAPFVLTMAADGLVDGVVTWHGSRMDSTVDRAGDIVCPVHHHAGGADAATPPELLAALAEAMAGNADAQIFVHDGAEHGFTHDGHAYDHDAERAAFGSVVELLDRRR